MRPSPAQSSRSGSAACSIADTSALPADTVHIVARDTRPLAARQRVRTLTRVDCEGILLPELATSWRKNDSATVWTFELSTNAASIAEAWQRARGTPRAWPHVIDVQAMTPATARIEFDRPEPDGPALMSDPRYGLASDSNRAHPAVVFVDAPANADLRDVLDRGLPNAGVRAADVLITRNPEVLAYAARGGAYRSVTLPWDRTYVLVAPGGDSTAVPTPVERDALARDAVQSEARSADPPFWWQHDSTCADTADRAASVATVVGYAAGDSIARQLAERIVALATSPNVPPWIPQGMTTDPAAPLRAVPFSADSLDTAIATGRIVAAVTAYPRVQPAACGYAARVPAGWMRIPLVESRAHALVRHGSGVRFEIEGDGTIRVVQRDEP
ncbi:MAG: hypothetical protein ACYCVL_04665 [Gemmatimonadaceae bacterium]